MLERGVLREFDGSARKRLGALVSHRSVHLAGSNIPPSLTLSASAGDLSSTFSSLSNTPGARKATIALVCSRVAVQERSLRAWSSMKLASR